MSDTNEMAPGLSAGQKFTGLEPRLSRQGEGLVARFSVFPTGMVLEDGFGGGERLELGAAVSTLDEALDKGEIGTTVVRVTLDEITELIRSEARGELPSRLVTGLGLTDLTWFAVREAVGADIVFCGFAGEGNPRSVREALGTVVLERLVEYEGMRRVMPHSVRVAGVVGESELVIGAEYNCMTFSQNKSLTRVNILLPKDPIEESWPWGVVPEVQLSNVLNYPYAAAGLMTSGMIDRIQSEWGDSGRVINVELVDVSGEGRRWRKVLPEHGAAEVRARRRLNGEVVVEIADYDPGRFFIHHLLLEVQVAGKLGRVRR